MKTVPPDRRNPKLVTAQGSEGRTQELRALMLCNIVQQVLQILQLPISRFTLRLTGFTTAGRNYACANALTRGFNWIGQLSCSGIPKTDTESKSLLKASPSVDGGTRKELITLSSPAKMSLDEVRLTKYPPEMAA